MGGDSRHRDLSRRGRHPIMVAGGQDSIKRRSGGGEEVRGAK